MKTCGGSGVWSASTVTSYPVTCWRFLRRMPMTSNAVHPASAIATNSIGFAPVLPAASSIRMWCPVPLVATNCRWVPLGLSQFYICRDHACDSPLLACPEAVRTVTIFRSR